MSLEEHTLFFQQDRSSSTSSTPAASGTCTERRGSGRIIPRTIVAYSDHHGYDIFEGTFQ